jgi:hypothetical protein
VSRGPVKKQVDEENTIRCASGARALIREEVYVDSSGQIVKYNLALIHHGLCQVDFGRVLGYDNAHGFHERHWMGTAEVVGFSTFAETLDRFIAEVDRIRREA